MTERAKLTTAGAIFLSLGSYWLGYHAAPREILDHEVRRVGLGAEDTRKVLAATVESLRGENKLLVYSYRSLVRVIVEKERLWLFHGRQELLAPSTVHYYVDLSRLGVASVRYDPIERVAHLTLPPLSMGDVAFHPDEATAVNGGLLSLSDDQVQSLNRMAYATARIAAIKQAQQVSIVQAARDQAAKAVAHNFAVTLAVAGAAGVRVEVRFAARAGS